MKCYRVWFEDGSALLVDATNEADAVENAIELAREQGSDERAGRIECLDQ